MIRAIWNLIFSVLKHYCDLQTTMIFHNITFVLQSSLLDRKLDFKRHIQRPTTPIFLFQMCIMTVKPNFVDSLVWVYVLIFDSLCFLSPF